jgi:uncharacterized damage-inducible protein DinB
MITLAVEELFAYTEEERSRWNSWMRLQRRPVFMAPLQHQGLFPNVWSLLDHIFVVEQRHLQRIRGEYPLPESTGVAEGNWDELWIWGTKTRRQLVSVAGDLSEEEARRAREVQLPHGWTEVSPRKLLFHVLLHEIRHWAQIALALRNAGYDPPGDHDLVFSSALM